MAFKTLPSTGGGTTTATIKAWRPSTTYAAGDLVNQWGRTYAARTGFTSGATFNFANWKPVGASTFQRLGALDREIAAVCLHSDDPTTLVKAALRRGFTPVWCSEIVAAMRGQIELPPNPLLLTFDDGRVQNYTVAFPVLQAYSFKANLFVVSDYVSGNYAAIDTGLPQADPPGTLGTAGPYSWTQAREMRDSGLFEFHVHTQTHHDIDSLTKAALIAELQTCSDALIAELGVPKSEVIAYPRGSVTAASVQTCREQGYVLGLDINGNIMQTDQFTRFPSGPMALPRATSAQLLERAYQQVMVDWNRDLPGEINAANVLGFWTMTSGSTLSSSGNGMELRAVRVNGTTPGLIETADTFKVIPGDRIRVHGSVSSVAQTTGTAVIRLLQYDINKTLLGTPIDLISFTAAAAATRLDVTKTLDPTCEFIKLRLDVPADCDASLRIRNPMVRRAAFA